MSSPIHTVMRVPSEGLAILVTRDGGAALTSFLQEIPGRIHSIGDKVVAVEIRSPSGPLWALEGDWLICRPDKSLTVCSPATFERFYRIVVSATVAPEKEVAPAETPLPGPQLELLP